MNDLIRIRIVSLELYRMGFKREDSGEKESCSCWASPVQFVLSLTVGSCGQCIVIDLAQHTEQSDQSDSVDHIIVLVYRSRR